MTKIGNSRKRKHKTNSWVHLNKDFIRVSCPFCRGYCPTLISHSKKNFGRHYYKCQRDACRFFLWWDHVYRSVSGEQLEAKIVDEKDLLREGNAELIKEIKRSEENCRDLQKKLDPVASCLPKKGVKVSEDGDFDYGDESEMQDESSGI